MQTWKGIFSEIFGMECLREGDYLLCGHFQNLNLSVKFLCMMHFLCRYKFRKQHETRRLWQSNTKLVSVRNWISTEFDSYNNFCSNLMKIAVTHSWPITVRWEDQVEKRVSRSCWSKYPAYARNALLSNTSPISVSIWSCSGLLGRYTVINIMFSP